MVMLQGRGAGLLLSGKLALGPAGGQGSPGSPGAGPAGYGRTVASVIGRWRLVATAGMGLELTRGRVEEHAKGGAGLLGKSWCAGFGRLELVVWAELRSPAGTRDLAGLSDPAKREPD